MIHRDTLRKWKKNGFNKIPKEAQQLLLKCSTGVLPKYKDFRTNAQNVRRISQ